MPRRSDGLSLASAIFAGLCVLATYGTANYVRGALEQLESYHSAWELVFWVSIAASAILFLPALRARQGHYSCRIYGERPAPCHTVKEGSRECLDARRRRGIEDATG